MRLRRGMPPILYELYDRDRKIGRLCKAQDGAVVLWLDGFVTAADAASAASLAFSGLLAYRAQGNPAGSLASAVAPRPSSPWATGDSAGTMNAAAHPNGGTIPPCLGDVEIAQVHPPPATDGAATWSVRMPLGDHDMPEVFSLAAARRMWEAVRRAGRRVGQDA
jgi:hypothetical protein